MPQYVVRGENDPTVISAGEGGATLAVTGATVYYRDEPGVSTSTYDGTIPADSSGTLYGTLWLTVDRTIDATTGLRPRATVTVTPLVSPVVSGSVFGDSSAAHNAAALFPFRVALADRLSNPCNIVVMGDSTDEGTGVGTLSTQRKYSWPDRLAALLRSRFPTSGETVEAEANFLPVNTTSTVVTGVAKTVGFGAASTQYGLNANAARSTAANDQLTFSLPAGISGFKVVSLGGTAATGYTLNIDGAGAGSTLGSPGSGSTTAAYVSPLQSIAAGSSHTVVLTTVGTNNYIFGLLTYAGNETKGIRVFNGAKHGSRVEHYRSGGSYNWLNATPAATTLAGCQSVIPMDPHLIVVGWGINDYTSSSPDVTAWTYRSYLESIVAGLRAMIPTRTIPVLVVGKWKPNSAQGGDGTWEDMRSARIAMAAADPYCAVLELGAVMPDIGSTLGTSLSLYSDTLHSNQKGYQFVADTIANFIAPS